jgi:hypothetical protein
MGRLQTRRNVAALLAASCATPAFAIIGRHDVPADAYLADPEGFSNVGLLMGQVESTLVAPRWAVTAAHTIERESPFLDWRVELRGRRFDIEKVILHPRRVRESVDSDFDLALLKLTEGAQGVTPAPLYDASDEVGREAILIGRGATGTGDRPAEAQRDGRLRRATNIVEAAFEHSLIFTFDTPPAGSALEGISGDGDSGGPAFINKDDQLRLAGVGSFNSTEHGGYGSVEGYARVSSHVEWLRSVMRDDPPSTLPRWEPFVSVRSAARLRVTSAGRAAARLYTAINSGSESVLADLFRAEALSTNRTPEERARIYVDFYTRHGRQNILGYRPLGERQIGVISRGTVSGGYQGFEIEVDEAGKLKSASAHRLSDDVLRQFIQIRG